jgi:hypothetical protein
MPDTCQNGALLQAELFEGTQASPHGAVPAVPGLGDGRGLLPLSLPIPCPGGNRPEG